MGFLRFLWLGDPVPSATLQGGGCGRVRARPAGFAPKKAGSPRPFPLAALFFGTIAIGCVFAAYSPIAFVGCAERYWAGGLFRREPAAWVPWPGWYASTRLSHFVNPAGRNQVGGGLLIWRDKVFTYRDGSRKPALYFFLAQVNVDIRGLRGPGCAIPQGRAQHGGWQIHGAGLNRPRSHKTGLHPVAPSERSDS